MFSYSVDLELFGRIHTSYDPCKTWLFSLIDCITCDLVQTLTISSSITMAKVMVSEWKKLPVSLAELCLDTTLRCGQSFRWKKIRGDEWYFGPLGKWFMRESTC